MKRMLEGIEQTKIFSDQYGQDILTTNFTNGGLEVSGITKLHAPLYCVEQPIYVGISGIQTNDGSNVPFNTKVEFGPGFVSRGPVSFDAPATFNAGFTSKAPISTTANLSVDGLIYYQSVQVPVYPTNTGTYVLKLTVAANGSKSFAWVAA